MLYLVYAILGVYCTRCMLYSVYAVLGVNSRSSHVEIERDDWGLCSAIIVELWTRKKQMGNEDENDMEDYEQTWEIRGTTCLIWLGSSCIGVITHQIRTRTCRIRDGKLTSTWNFLKSQFFMMISPIPSHLSLSCPQFYYHLRTRSQVIPLYLSMAWSSVNTEYSIHRVQHTLSTAYTAYCIISRSTVSRSQPVSSLGRRCCTQFSIFAQLWVNQSIESQLLSYLPPEQPPPDWPPPVTPPISLGYGLQVHLHTRSIMASKCISQLARPERSSVSLNLHDYGLQLGMITATYCISKLTQLRPRSLSPHLFDYGLQVRMIMASKCIYTLAWSQPPSTSPNSLNHGLQVHLQTRSITAFKCISKLARLQTPSSYDHGLQVHLQTRSITASKLYPQPGSNSALECISKLTRSWCGETVERAGRHPIISTLLHLAWYPNGIYEKEWF